MSQFLMLRLYGSMASWGDIAVGEQRLSHGHPTKSAIIGLLAAALGIKREEEERQQALARGYYMAVRVDSAGALLRDYHTVQVPPPDRGRCYATRKDELSVPKHMMNTILSQRDYRVDAHYTVAIYQNDGPYSLDVLALALKSPRYPLYLGRKSCPLAFPLQPTVMGVDHLKSAFEQMPVENDIFLLKSLSATTANKQRAYYWEGLKKEQTGFSAEGTYMKHERRDQVASRKRWQFVSRQEHQLLLNEEGE